MAVPFWLGLLQHDHRVGLSEERASCAHLPHFYELHYNLLKVDVIRQMDIKPREALDQHPKTYLLIKVNEYVVGQLERFDCQQD